MGDKRGVLLRLRESLQRAISGLLIGLLFVIMVALIVALPYMLIRASSEYLPGWLHSIAIAIAAFLLGGGIYIISTTELRKKWFPWIFEMFGPFGPPVYGALILFGAAATMASFTKLLVDAELVEMSSNLSGGLTEARLVDFYLWHFFELIPLVSINETANLAEPATYSGTWVGLLVLVFQGLVVAPIFATIRYYFKAEGRETREKYRQKRRVVNTLRTAFEQGDGAALKDLLARQAEQTPTQSRDGKEGSETQA